MLRLATAVLALCAPFAAAAADLLPPRLDAADLAPAAYPPAVPPPTILDAPGYDEDLVVRRRILAPPVPVERQVVVTSPLAVGGPYLSVPGLNGPTGPSAYPLLPYAFGYGY